MSPRRRLHTLIALTTLLASGMPSRARGQTVPSDSAILAMLRLRVDQGTARGMIVGVLENGRRRYVTYGTAGPGRPPLDEHTIFEIGSISKTFTALLLADAVARGELKLDQPVAELLPAGTVVPARGGRRITLEQLATHRSGLPSMPENFTPADPADPYVDYDVARMYAFMAGYQLPRSPGESSEYSNLGYGLLGHALARHAGTATWSALVERRITGPLGMRETVVDVPSSLRARVAAGYGGANDTVPAWHLDALAGAGALRSTAADLLTYLAAQVDTAQGPVAKAAALARPPRASFAAGMRIGLGWFVRGDSLQATWWHNGGTGGFRTFAGFDPVRRTGIVVLSNGGVSVDDLGIHLLDPKTPLLLPVRPPSAAVTLTLEQLDRLVGDYTLSAEFALSVSREGEALFVQATGQPRFALTALAPNHFVVLSVNAEFVFDTSEPGRAKHVTLRQNGRTVTGARRP